MKKILFFLNAFPIRLKPELLILFLMETFKASGLLRKFFHNYVLESRAILGFIYDRNGSANSKKDGMEIQLPLNKITISLLLRWNSSDFLVFAQVFIKEEYKPLTDLKINNPRIIDAGANIGCTSIYLSAYYPNAKIIALEPDRGNFELLKKNFLLNGLGSALSLPIALWYTNSNVSITNNHIDKRNWSMKIVEQGYNSVEAKTMETILKETEFDGIDILKMDIEGSEEIIFERDDKMIGILARVKGMAIEIHDGNSCVPDKLSKMRLPMFTQGETLFVKRNDF